MCIICTDTQDYNGEKFKLAGTVSRPRASLMFSLAYTVLANTSHRHMQHVRLFALFFRFQSLRMCGTIGQSLIMTRKEYVSKRL